MHWVNNDEDAVNGLTIFCQEDGEMVSWDFHLKNGHANELAYEAYVHGPNGIYEIQYDENGQRIWKPAVRYKIADDYWETFRTFHSLCLYKYQSVGDLYFYKFTTEFFEPRREWLKENCKSRYWFFDRYIDFESIDDAIAFDSVWGSEAVGYGNHENYQL